MYLLRSGKYYKIGHTNHPGRRTYEIGLALPEKVIEVHKFKTDDPDGIERYWHERFRDKRVRGEWFRLSREDIDAFRRRRDFM